MAGEFDVELNEQVYIRAQPRSGFARDVVVDLKRMAAESSSEYTYDEESEQE